MASSPHFLPKERKAPTALKKRAVFSASSILFSMTSCVTLKRFKMMMLVMILS